MRLEQFLNVISETKSKNFSQKKNELMYLFVQKGKLQSCRFEK